MLYFCEELISSTKRLIKRDLCTFLKYKQKQVLKDLVASVCTQICCTLVQYLHKCVMKTQKFDYVHNKLCMCKVTWCIFLLCAATLIDVWLVDRFVPVNHLCVYEFWYFFVTVKVEVFCSCSVTYLTLISWPFHDVMLPKGIVNEWITTWRLLLKLQMSCIISNTVMLMQ